MAYFTAIFPYIVLLVLIIFTATLNGVGEVIRFYVVPRWKLIGNFQVTIHTLFKTTTRGNPITSDLASSCIASLLFTQSELWFVDGLFRCEQVQQQFLQVGLRFLVECPFVHRSRL